MAKISTGNSQHVIKILADLKAVLELDDDAVAHVSLEGSPRPNGLLIHPKHGLMAIEIGGKGENVSDIRVRLNRKVESLRNQLGHTQEFVIQNIAVSMDPGVLFEPISQTSFVVSAKEVKNIEWKKQLCKVAYSAAALKNLQSRLWPSMSFKIDTYIGTSDLNKENRNASRAILDSEQANIALTDVTDVMVIAGPPGSGKSLILASRAKHLAQLHPEWKIVIVVYNRMLAKHFEASEDFWPKNVEIVTLKNLLEKRGEKVLARLTSQFDDREQVIAEARNEVERKKKTGIDADIDALLIDEWQDFDHPFLEYLLECVRSSRGGMVCAGDVGQAIYTDGLPSRALKGRKVKNVRLGRPYRSTRQILDVAQALDDQYVVEGTELALVGEPVSLIFAPTWELQAEAIAWEIDSLVGSGERKYGEIVVLCTTKSGANTVERVFVNHGIPNVVHSRIWEDSDIAHDEVNVMTIHGGKGFGFKVVFVLGFETLRDLNGTKEREKWGRVGYVAVTRAEDLLFILYKTQTQFMLNLKKCDKSTLVARSYPDDYEM